MWFLSRFIHSPTWFFNQIFVFIHLRIIWKLIRCILNLYCPSDHFMDFPPLSIFTLLTEPNIRLICQGPQSGSSLRREAYIRYLVSIRNLVNLPCIDISIENFRIYDIFHNIDFNVYTSTTIDDAFFITLELRFHLTFKGRDTDPSRFLLRFWLCIYIFT